MPTPEEFRRAMAAMPTAVTVVTAVGPDGPLGATANAVSSLSLEPPLMMAALDRRSRTLEAILDARRFGINVLAAGQGELARRFATKDPHEEKWTDVAWRETDGTPWIDGVLVFVGCALRDVNDGGDHRILVGDVLTLGGDGGRPLVFDRGAYRDLRG